MWPKSIRRFAFTPADSCCGPRQGIVCHQQSWPRARRWLSTFLGGPSRAVAISRMESAEKERDELQHPPPMLSLRPGYCRTGLLFDHRHRQYRQGHLERRRPVGPGDDRTGAICRLSGLRGWRQRQRSSQHPFRFGSARAWPIRRRRRKAGGSDQTTGDAQPSQNICRT